MSEPLKPGDILLVAIEIPEGYEGISPELAFADYIANPHGWDQSLQGVKRKVEVICDDGEKVGDGDEIIFSYGIPPVQVLATVELFEGELWALTPGHKPSRCRLSELREHVGLFHKS